MVSVFKGEVHMDNPFLPYEVYNKKDIKSTRLKYEGLYVFGGCDDLRTSSNKLFII